MNWANLAGCGAWGPQGGTDIRCRLFQTRDESSQSADDGPVSVSNELPGAGNKPANAAIGDQSRKTEEIVNYEIWRVNRVSAAVLVDGTYGKNDKGEVTYQPRSKEDIDRIAALVGTAIGFDPKRGD